MFPDFYHLLPISYSYKCTIKRTKKNTYQRVIGVFGVTSNLLQLLFGAKQRDFWPRWRASKALWTECNPI